MKILFVSSLYPSHDRPQYCVFLEQQARALRELGHDVDVLVLKPVNSVAKMNEIRGTGQRNGVTLYIWQYSSNKVGSILGCAVPQKPIETFLMDKGYEAISFHMGNVGAFTTIAKICKRKNIVTLMHFHGLNVWKEYYPNRKTKLLQPYLIWRRKLFLRDVTGVVGVSACTCNVIREHYNGHIYKVYNGVDVERFSPNEQRIFSAQPFRILCVANLIPIKGQRFLIQAVHEVLKKGYKVELYLVGEGTERSALEEECVHYGVENSVHFQGVLPYEGVSREMKNADMFILPSYFEAFGCVYVEAMASGTLTCGCHTGGAGEIISDKINGLLVKEKDVRSIVDAIIFAIENTDKAREIAKNGRLRAEAFTWRASARELERVYYALQPK